jgi:hypothetical protein
MVGLCEKYARYIQLPSVVLAKARIQAGLVLSLANVKASIALAGSFNRYFFGYSPLFFAFSASYFSLLAQRISNQKKGHPSIRLYPALLVNVGVQRNSP